jgi:hypothetical protein
MSTPAVDLAKILDACAEAVRRGTTQGPRAHTADSQGQVAAWPVAPPAFAALLRTISVAVRDWPYPGSAGHRPHCKAFGLGLLFSGRGLLAGGFSGVAFAVAARIPTLVLSVYSAGFPR